MVRIPDILDKERIILSFEQWWEHTLDRPIIQVTLNDARKNASGDFFGSNYRRDILNACYDLDLPAAEAARQIKTAYEQVEFMGDAFPVFYMRPTGVLGAFLGQEWGINHEMGTVWFVKTGQDLEEISRIRIDTGNLLFQRALELTERVQDQFEGNIAVGVPDLGGVYDILASIYDPNNLLPDLCSEGDAVKKAAWNIYEQMKEGIALFQERIHPEKILGYTCWATMLSQKPYYVLQNDFSAMIGPKMFDDFYLPILREESRMVPRTIYHLDGPAAVRHLDSILTVKELSGVQWVNGAGSAGLDKWSDIYRKVISAGKLCQVFINGADELRYIDDIVDIAGTTKGLCFICTGDQGEKMHFERFLSKYNVI